MNIWLKVMEKSWKMCLYCIMSFVNFGEQSNRPTWKKTVPALLPSQVKHWGQPHITGIVCTRTDGRTDGRTDRQTDRDHSITHPVIELVSH